MSTDSGCTSSSFDADVTRIHDPVKHLRKLHLREREKLVLTKRPFATLKFFLLAVIQHLKQFWTYALSHKFTFLLSVCLCVVAWLGFLMFGGPPDKIVEESWAYFRFALWWVGLGVASSIGLGSGLHTFVLYLGPHIAMFTLKATLCGREDLKVAPYDTAQFGSLSSWADKDCESFGPPKYTHLPSEHGYLVPLHTILMQVQPEAVLWGIGTALGELPPYFVSRAARMSGERLKELDEIANEEDEGANGSSLEILKHLKQWMLSHIQNFGFLTILIFASVPNPLFDLAGIMCGQFLVPFWKFFMATVIGKALIKTHIQTIFIIMVSNAHLMEVTFDLLARMLLRVPAFSFMIPKISSALANAQDKFRHGQAAIQKTRQSSVSVAGVWNAMVMLMLMGFLGSIVTSTAQGYLVERQMHELDALQSKQQNESTLIKED